jgi:hypothetical protein
MKTVSVKKKSTAQILPRAAENKIKNLKSCKKIISSLQLKNISDSSWTVPVSQIQSVTSYPFH